MSSNFVIVCRKYYLIVLLSELGFDLRSFNAVGNQTYAPVISSINDIIAEHCTALKDSFGITVKDKFMVLPKLFWIPKLHKNPYKSRFIAGARNSTSKDLAILVNKGLQLVRDKFSSYCLSIKHNSGVNAFWSINSSGEFLDRMSGLNCHSLQVYDFSTLYTNLNLDQVMESLKDLCELIFSSSKSFICIGYYRTFFSNKKYRGYHCWSKTQFLNAISFILNNTFVTFGGLVFKQIRGIPMGGNSSSLLADLFLAYREFYFVRGLLASRRFGLAKLLSRTTRYVDDICVFNFKHFDKILPEIYPVDLLACRSGDNNKCVNYLDVKIRIEDGGHYITEVYHKVDEFSFPVVLYTFPESNMPLNTGLNIFAAQLIRFARISSDASAFISRAKGIFDIFKGRGYKNNLLVNSCIKSFSKNRFLVFKFGCFSPRQMPSIIGMLG